MSSIKKVFQPIKNAIEPYLRWLVIGGLFLSIFSLYNAKQSNKKLRSEIETLKKGSENIEHEVHNIGYQLETQRQQEERIEKQKILEQKEALEQFDKTKYLERFPDINASEKSFVEKAKGERVLELEEEKEDKKQNVGQFSLLPISYNLSAPKDTVKIPETATESKDDRAYYLSRWTSKKKQ